MLVNPNVQQPAYTAQPAPAPNGVGQVDVVRSDLAPVKESPESSAGQNQLLQSDDRFRESQRRSTLAQTQQPATETTTPNSGSAPAARQNGNSQTAAADDGQGGSEEQLAEQQRDQDAAIIRQLKARDREVRLHEAAHAAVGGRYAGSPSFQFERGPDGVNYAVEGEVSISVSKAATPEQTLEKARQIRAAATAPAEPSAQDRSVAAEASRLEAEARAEIQAQEVAEREERSERLDNRGDEDREDDRVSAADDAREAPEEVTVADNTFAPENNTPTTGTQSADNQDREQSSQDSEENQDDRNAKERLEEILLGNQSIPEALNRAGLVDTQNPYGRSGFIQYIV